MREAEYLRRQADECRALARRAVKWETIRALNQLASYYDKEAAAAEASALRLLQ